MGRLDSPLDDSGERKELVVFQCSALSGSSANAFRNGSTASIPIHRLDCASGATSSTNAGEPGCCGTSPEVATRRFRSGHRGVLVADVAAAGLTGAVLNRYLEVKDRNLL
jgi:hypothetical protein